jgi:LPS O-antigen subunit length determinant protein (WzzB/FepE family)
MQAGTGMDRAEEIDFVRLIQDVWRRKLAVAAGTFVITVSGLIYAYTTPSVYMADAIIAPKESKSQGNMPFLPGLGGLGGLVTQMAGGSTNVDRLDLMVRGRDLAQRVIEENQLLDELFPGAWDASKQEWKRGSTAPSLRSGIDHLRMNMLKVVVNPKKAIITVGITSHDSTLAAKIVAFYLEALNRKIQFEVRRDADTNRRYLESQLSVTSDPLLREKIQSLIGLEIERSMLVSSKSFDILEMPVVPNIRERPKRQRIAIFSFLAGLVVSIVAAASWSGVRNQLRRFRSMPSVGG